MAYEALGGQNGTVGIYNYKTGEILCMVSTPTFDPADPPNIAADDPAWDGVYVNRLLSANSIPGSILKVVTLNAAIENIPDLFQRKWNCTGSVEIGGDTVSARMRTANRTSSPRSQIPATACSVSLPLSSARRP